MDKENIRNTELVKCLRHAIPYITKHTEKTFVITLDSLTFGDSNFLGIIDDISVLHSLNIKLVIVFGARHLVNKQLEQNNLPVRYHKNSRITDAETLTIVKQISGQIQYDILSSLSTRMISNQNFKHTLNVVTGNFVIAKPLGIEDGIDYQYGGKIRRIDIDGIQKQLEHNSIVLIGPIATSVTGELFNLLYEDVAAKIAVGLRADKLISFSPNQGILDSEDRVISELTINEANDYLTTLIEAGRGLEEQTRFLQTAIYACNNGVDRAHLISHKLDGALLEELFSREGIGTQIAQINAEIIRNANLDDIPSILALIYPLELKGVLIARTKEQLETDINEYVVIDLDGSIIACASLHLYSEEKMAEMACVAVHQDYQKTARGDSLLTEVESRAKAQNIEQLFVLTTKTSHWFQERGFKLASIEQLPLDKQQHYDFKRASNVLIKDLS